MVKLRSGIGIFLVASVIAASPTFGDLSLQITQTPIAADLQANGWIGLEISFVADTPGEDFTGIDLKNVVRGISLSGAPGITGTFYQTANGTRSSASGELPDDPTEIRDSYFLTPSQYLAVPDSFSENNSRQFSSTTGTGSSMTFAGVTDPSSRTTTMNLALVIVQAGAAGNAIRGAVTDASGNFYALDHSLVAGTYALQAPVYAPPPKPVAPTLPPAAPAPAPVVVVDPPAPVVTQTPPAAPEPIAPPAPAPVVAPIIATPASVEPVAPVAVVGETPVAPPTAAPSPPSIVEPIAPVPVVTAPPTAPVETPSTPAQPPTPQPIAPVAAPTPVESSPPAATPVTPTPAPVATTPVTAQPVAPAPVSSASPVVTTAAPTTPQVSNPTTPTTTPPSTASPIAVTPVASGSVPTQSPAPETITEPTASDNPPTTPTPTATTAPDPSTPTPPNDLVTGGQIIIHSTYYPIFTTGISYQDVLMHPDELAGTLQTVSYALDMETTLTALATTTLAQSTQGLVLLPSGKANTLNSFAVPIFASTFPAVAFVAPASASIFPAVALDSPTPEPCTLSVMASGAVMLLARRKW